MEQAFSIAALWFGLALLATFLASRLESSMARIGFAAEGWEEVGADPPLSADELTLVQEIAKQRDALLFVLNEAVRLPGSGKPGCAARDQPNRNAERSSGCAQFPIEKGCRS